MLLELKQQFDLVYPDADLSRYRVIVLPDRGSLPDVAVKNLKAFVRRGGAVILSYQAALERDGQFRLPGVPVRVVGSNPAVPCYMELGRELGEGLPESQYVFYDNSNQVRALAGSRAYGALVDSYFNRTYDHFCSHNQTPASDTTSHPVAVRKGSIVYLAPALFGAYREHAFPLYKALFARVLDMVLPDPLVRADAPSAMEISLLRQTGGERRQVVHLVNFQPQRRHAHVEWIDKIYPVRDVALAVRTQKKPTAVYTAPNRTPLAFEMNGAYCQISVPEVHAHQMVVFEGV